MKPLLDLLVVFDKHVTPIGLFRTHGDDLFPLIFKLTFYNDKRFSVTNHPLD